MVDFSAGLPPVYPVTVSLQDRVVWLDNARYHGGEREEAQITLLVMHSTQGDSAASSIEWLNREFDEDDVTWKIEGRARRPLPKKKRASYHYIIERDGIIYRMTKISIIANHAGDSGWPNPIHYPPGNGMSVNSVSVGIAWANHNEKGEELTRAQIESGLWLCRFLSTRLRIPVSRIVGHIEVSPGRKNDPRGAIRMQDWRGAVAGEIDLLAA